MTGVSIAINAAGGNDPSSNPATPMNWKAAVSVNGGATYGAIVNPGAAIAPAGSVSLPVTLTGGEVALSGTLSSLNIFGVINASASFAMSETTVAVHPGTGTNLGVATLITLALQNLSASVGAGGFGVAVTGGTLGLAFLEPVSSTGSTDHRYWVAVTGTGLSASLQLSTSVTASVTGLSIAINQAGGGASALDWTSAISLDGGSTFGGVGNTVNPGQDLPTPVSLAIGFTVPTLEMSGTLSSLNVFNLIQGSASFALSVTAAVGVIVPVAGGGTTTLAGATLIQVGLSGIQASAGASGIGLAITGGDLGIAFVEPPSPASGTDSRYWIGVDASGLAASLTLGGVTASASSLSIQVNRAGGKDPIGNAAVALNWMTDVTQGGNPIAVDPGPDTRAAGRLAADQLQPANIHARGDRRQHQYLQRGGGIGRPRTERDDGRFLVHGGLARERHRRNAFHPGSQQSPGVGRQRSIRRRDHGRQYRDRRDRGGRGPPVARTRDTGSP